MTRISSTISCSLLASALLSPGAASFADCALAAEQKPKSQGAVDNSAHNRELQAHDQLTADDQSYAKDDLELLAKIRRAVVGDDGLSVYAQNVKIITKSGVVYLKGPVKNESERKAVEKIAANIAGKDKVRNELEVTRDSH